MMTSVWLAGNVRNGWRCGILVCAAIASSGLGCGVDADQTEAQPAGAQAVASGCVTAVAHGGFVNLPIASGRVLNTVRFTATPSGPGIDAVVGITAGRPATFADVAVAVRFAPSGAVDARDGSAYRADVAIPYGSSAMDFRVIADVTSKTFSVFQGVWSDADELARQYAFRPGAPATQLDNVAVFVDGDAGSLEVCADNQVSSHVLYSREGAYTSAAVLPGDQIVVSDGVTTSKLNAAGRVNSRITRGGQLAADASGNVVIASVTGTTLAVDRYDPTLHLLWHDSVAVASGTVVSAVAAGADVAIGLAAPGFRVTLLRLDRATGSVISQLPTSGSRVGFDGAEAIVEVHDRSSVVLTRLAADGTTRWSRTFAGEVNVTALTVDPSGAVIFGGEMFTAMDFGGGTLPLRHPDTGALNGFVVKLDAAGNHVYSMRTEYTLVGGIASNGARTVVSNTERTQFRYPHLTVLDPAGARIAMPFDTSFGEHGVGGNVWISASNRVWWAHQTLWPQFPAWDYLVAIAP